MAWDDGASSVTLPMGGGGGGGTVAILYLRYTKHNYTLKVGFDDNFNPFAQYGGRIFSLDIRPLIPPQAVEAILHLSWMIVSGSQSSFVAIGCTAFFLVKFPWTANMQSAVLGVTYEDVDLGYRGKVKN